MGNLIVVIPMKMGIQFSWIPDQVGDDRKSRG